MDIPIDYLVHLAILVCIYIILAQSFNLNFGLGGQFNLAHIASYAIGAYTSALLSTYHNFHFLSCILFSMFFAAIFSFFIGAIAAKLSHDYFAIGTLAFSSIVSALLINWKSLTRGVLGISGIPRPEIFNIDFNDNLNFLYLILIFTVISSIFFYFLFISSYAKKLKAQSEFEDGARALAINSTLVKNTSFVISSAFAGLAGSFFAYYINYIDPSSFAFHEMIFVLTIIVVGKPGSYKGCIFATCFLVLLPEPLRFIDMPPSILGPLRQMLYSVILFLVVYVNRSVLFPVERKI